MKFRVALLLTSMLALADAADDLSAFTAGKLSLKRFLEHSRFELDYRYVGKLSLAYPKPTSAAEDLPRDIELNCLACNSENYSASDQPRPKLPGLFRGSNTPEQSTGFTYGEFFFLDPDIPSTTELQRAPSVAAIRKLVPRLVRELSEDDTQRDPVSYWYSWAHLTDTGDIEITRIEVSCPRKTRWDADETAPLKSLRIWTGTLKPTRPNHALQRTAPRVTVAAISSSDPSRPSHLLS